LSFTTKYFPIKVKLKGVLLIYIINLILWTTFIAIKFFDENFLEIVFTVFTSTQGIVLLHVSFVIITFFIFYFRKHYKAYRENGLRKLFLFFFRSTVLPLSTIGVSLYIINAFNTSEDFNIINSTKLNYSQVSNDFYQQDFKIRGASVFGLNRDNNDKISTIIQNNVEWVALHPYIYQNDESDSENPFKKDNWSKRDSAYSKTINKLHSKNIHVMLKPHLWVVNGWRNNINFKDSKKWGNWFQSYSKTILAYAILAEKTNVELFCVGTELDKTLTNHKQDWLKLIKEIKKVYGGKLTYAMNWDTKFFNSEFWCELDYIGIQAYYPLTKNKEPTLSEIKKGWQEHKANLKTVANLVNRPVLFTEIGYRNDMHATIKPWEWSNLIERFFRKKSNKTQYYAFKAFFEEVWEEPWFSGMFIWQWNKNSDFSIINKPAQNLVMDEFSKLIKSKVLNKNKYNNWTIPVL